MNFKGKKCSQMLIVSIYIGSMINVGVRKEPTKLI